MAADSSESRSLRRARTGVPRHRRPPRRAPASPRSRQRCAPASPRAGPSDAAALLEAETCHRCRRAGAVDGADADAEAVEEAARGGGRRGGSLVILGGATSPRGGRKAFGKRSERLPSRVDGGAEQCWQVPSGALKESAPDVWDALAGRDGVARRRTLLVLKRGKRVIVDKCSVTRADRKTLLDLALRPAGCVCVFVDAARARGRAAGRIDHPGIRFGGGKLRSRRLRISSRRRPGAGRRRALRDERRRWRPSSGAPTPQPPPLGPRARARATCSTRAAPPSAATPRDGAAAPAASSTGARWWSPRRRSTAPTSGSRSRRRTRCGAAELLALRQPADARAVQALGSVDRRALVGALPAAAAARSRCSSASGATPSTRSRTRGCRGTLSPSTSTTSAPASSAPPPSATAASRASGSRAGRRPGVRLEGGAARAARDALGVHRRLRRGRLPADRRRRPLRRARQVRAPRLHPGDRGALDGGRPREERRRPRRRRRGGVGG